MPRTRPAEERSRRHRDVRKVTIAPYRDRPKATLAAAEPPHERPATRADCKDGPRPCPYAGCRYHLYLDISQKTGGVIIVNFPDLEPDELAETCALDVADDGGETLEEVGRLMNVTRERVRQIEAKGLRKLAGKKALRVIQAAGVEFIAPHAEVP